MLAIDSSGIVVHPNIKRDIKPSIERGPLKQVNGIVVHQTDSSTATSTLDHYAKPGSNGAHFLIAKDGSIYQTASVFKQTAHVGILKSRCLTEKTCTPSEFKTASKLKIHELSKHELRKSWPQRYPTNRDAIGIELVGKFIASTGKFESVTAEQNASLKWLILGISISLGVSTQEVFRHPEVSYKQPSEAETAQW